MYDLGAASPGKDAGGVTLNDCTIVTILAGIMHATSVSVMDLKYKVSACSYEGLTGTSSVQMTEMRGG